MLEKLNKNLSINGYQQNDDECHCKTEAKTVLSKCTCIKTNNQLVGSHWSFELARNGSALEFSRDELQYSNTMKQDTSLSTFQECNQCCGLLAIPQQSKDYKPHENNVEKNSWKRVHLDQKDHHMTLSRDKIKVNVVSMRLDWEEVDMDDLEGLSSGVILATGEYSTACCDVRKLVIKVKTFHEYRFYNTRNEDSL